MNKIKILAIDDDPDFNALLAKRLEQFDIEVHTTQKCSDFIEQLRTVKPDLCIIDINLEEGQGSGFLLLKAIKNSSFDTITFILSRRSNDNDIQKALELGADEFISKPLDEITLIEKINKRLNISLQSTAFKYKTIADAYTDALATIPTRISSITEKGIFVRSKHIFKTGIYLQTRSIKDEIITTLSRESVRLKVTDMQYLPQEECYQTELHFDQYDRSLIDEIRDWLIENC